MQDLEGRVAVVTGGGSGIGRGICQQLAAEAMRVVVADIEASAGEETVGLIDGEGGAARFEHADVSDPASMESLAARVYDRFGAVHLLCNNAGVIVRGPAAEATAAEWRWLLSVNLEGVANGVRAFVPRMRAQADESHIVNTSSIAGIAPLVSGENAVYASTKAAVAVFTEVLRRELEPDGIGVSMLLPGRTPSRLQYSARNRPDEFGGRVVEEERDPEARFREATVKVKHLQPIENARALVQGVRDNRLYIMADPERRDGPETRNARMSGDFDAAEAGA